MKIFKVKNVEFQTVGVGYYEYLCEGEKKPRRCWWVDVKNLGNGKIKTINFDKIKQYL